MPEDPPAAIESPPTIPLKTRLAVAAAILTVACASLAHFYSRGLINLYGDAMAHLEGARRLIDSLTPGYLELGTVWLPIPHLLMSLPAQNDFLWRTGLAGGIVSSLAFALAAWLIFRLSCDMNGHLEAGIVALAGFLLCPNMLYLASTPLTEPLAILFVILLVRELFRLHATGAEGALIGAALAGWAGTLTRYECWSLLPFAAIFVMWARRDAWPHRLRRALLFSIITGAGPALWLLHNAYRYGNPLEFYNGPFSAKGIYEHQLATTAFRFPTDGSLVVSARYYLEDLQLVIGVWPLALALLGLVAWAADAPRRERRAAALLLLLPLPFHIQSIAHAAVPLYVPTLFPHTYWNLRLGMEMLPAVALLPSFLVPARVSRRARLGIAVGLALLITGQHVWTSSRGAAELAVAKEGVLNTPCHSQRQQSLTRFLREHYDGEMILMAAGKWPCVLPALGIPFRKTLSDANRAPWARMKVEPEQWVKWIVRGDNEPVDWLMRAHPQSFANFEVVFREEVAGEGSLTVYRRRGG
jgi:hypothetical protein